MREITICKDDIVVNTPEKHRRQIDVVVDGGRHYARFPFGRYLVETDETSEVVGFSRCGSYRGTVEIPADARVFTLSETMHTIEYYDERAGRILTPAEYHDERARLESSGRPDCDGEPVFERLEDRHTWESFNRYVRPSAQTIVSTRTPVTLRPRTVPVSEHECIQPLRWVRGTLDLDRRDVETCVYTPPVMDMLWEAARETGLSFELPDYSARDRKLEYLKIEGSYCSWDRWHRGIGDRGLLRSFTGSYDECLRRYTEHREGILSLFWDALSARTADLTTGELARRLEKIRSKAQSDRDGADSDLAALIREISGRDA